jgi:3-oxoadipate enol-lactonase
VSRKYSSGLAKQWELAPDDARRVAQPALAVRGERSVLTFAGRLALLESWLPDSRPFELPGATHLLHVQEPGAMASALAAFFARHPVAVGSPSA